MKIEIPKIPFEGIRLQEEINPARLELESDIARCAGPLVVVADVAKITNVVTVHLTLHGRLHLLCSRCLEEFETPIEKKLQLNYPVDKGELVLDLNPDIRQELMLEYPLQAFCSPQCQGLCPRCGKNLNQGKCNCIV